MNDPRDFNCPDTLRNGLAVTIRHLRDDDRERIADAVRQLDRESIYTRFFGHRELTEAGLDRLMAVDPKRTVALVVTTGADEIVIGAGRYVVANPDAAVRTAEVAFMVEEDYHGLGIAGRLLRHFTDIARAQGIASFEADVLAHNKSMLAVFARSGLPMRRRNEGASVHVTLSLRGDEAQVPQ